MAIRVALLVGLFGASAFAAPPLAGFGDKIPDDAALDKLWHEVPAPVRPAVEFQKIVAKIRTANKPAEWRADVEKFVKAAGDDPVSANVREFAKLWLARAMMEEVDGALRKYYRREVRFPDSLAAVQQDIPADARQDPWSEPWSYKVTSPKGFTKFVKQRYQLGPTRAPTLSPLAEAVKPKPAPQGWKLIARDVAGAKALEMRGTDGKVAVVQAGGHFADATLLFVGEGWALMVDAERMFALTF